MATGVATGDGEGVDVGEVVEAVVGEVAAVEVVTEAASGETLGIAPLSNCNAELQELIGAKGPDLVNNK